MSSRPWPLPTFTCDTGSCHLFSFSPARCRLWPVRLAERVICTDNQRCPQVMAGQHPAPFRAEMAHFCSERCMPDGCIVGFARLVYLCYCLTHMSELFSGTFNIWYLYNDMTLVIVFCPGKIKMMYQQQDVLMGTLKMHCQQMCMMWNKFLWKKLLLC